eukprot:6176838-Pleurochrysis_carterae.AAC.1
MQARVPLSVHTRAHRERPVCASARARTRLGLGRVVGVWREWLACECAFFVVRACVVRFVFLVPDGAGGVPDGAGGVSDGAGGVSDGAGG